MKHKLVIAALTALLVFAVNVRAQSERDKMIEAAKKEREVSFYGGFSVSDVAGFINKFQKKYPFIRVNHLREGAEKLMTRVLTERQAGRHSVDVIQARGFPARVMLDKGVFVKYVSPEAKVYPKGFVDPDGRWATMYVQTSVIGYNTNFVKPGEIKNWEDLTNPKWKGQMVIDREETEWFANMLEVMGREKGLAYMRRIAQQNPTLWEGHTLMAQLVAAGEHPIGISLYGPRIEDLKARGAPVEWVRSNPVIGFLYLVALADKAPHPNAARLLIDFALSKEGQMEITESRRISMRPDVKPNPPGLVEGVHVHASNLDLARDYNRLYKDFQDIFGKK
ncbi:MAG TPA: extracellular solute-binding protein [Candidatus Binatia bacterium]|jgi:iron(III) transport system substrate-binding protein